ncbi:MAG: hypothetical protein AAF542_16915 [Pseudomonadota bacterium]
MKFAYRVLVCVCIAIVFSACGTSPHGATVAVLVQVDRPEGVSDQDLKAGFEGSLPQYQRISGLQRKYFVYTNAQFGGVYLWDSRSSAEAFFNESWRGRIASTYGNNATLTYFDVPTETEGASPESAGEDGIVAIVKVGAPWYAPRAIISSRMQESLSEYASVAGLDYKIYSIGQGKKIGGIYLWDNEKTAKTFYNDAWHKRIHDTYGEDAELELYAAPVILINENSIGS